MKGLRIAAKGRYHTIASPLMTTEAEGACHPSILIHALVRQSFEQTFNYPHHFVQFIS